MTSKFEQLQEVIGLDSELNNIQDLDILLERILLEARKVLNADAGSIYIKKKNELVIEYSQNNTKQRELPSGQKLIYNRFSIPIDKKTISGYVASTGELVNIPDVYKIPEKAPYSYNTKYDKLAKYKTHSILTVPLTTNTGELIGVIQMINALNDKGKSVPFRDDDLPLIRHFATNASIALQRAKMTRAIILRMIRMAELRDPKETGPHVNRVAGYSVEIYEHWAKKKGVDEQEMHRTMDTLRMAAMLHDVGKVAISDVILKKPARFTEEEYEIMKSHTLHGARLFNDKQSIFDELAMEVALSHHENWDGTGYPGKVDINTEEPLETGKKENPEGKKGEEIPFFGRIVALADVYDALSSKRVYKEAWKEEDVLEEMRKLSGTKFDPELVDIFFKVLPNIKAITQKYGDVE
jgi:HD-GYP domain-containing protein (c-di-GMP phosphodiesterase class II)